MRPARSAWSATPVSTTATTTPAALGAGGGQAQGRAQGGAGHDLGGDAARGPCCRPCLRAGRWTWSGRSGADAQPGRQRGPGREVGDDAAHEGERGDHVAAGGEHGGGERGDVLGAGDDDPLQRAGGGGAPCGGQRGQRGGRQREGQRGTPGAPGPPGGCGRPRRRWCGVPSWWRPSLVRERLRTARRTRPQTVSTPRGVGLATRSGDPPPPGAGPYVRGEAGRGVRGARREEHPVSSTEQSGPPQTADGGPLHVERRDDGVVLLTFALPERRNVMSPELTAAWGETIAGLRGGPRRPRGGRRHRRGQGLLRRRRRRLAGLGAGRQPRTTCGTGCCRSTRPGCRCAPSTCRPSRR